MSILKSCRRKISILEMCQCQKGVSLRELYLINEFWVLVNDELILFCSSSMAVYHENCGKPGPNSISYIPPPEARLFKSRSAPGSPRLDRQPLGRSASFRQPRQTRASFLLREAQMKKVEKYKTEKSAKIGRSKSFTSRLTSRFYGRSKFIHDILRWLLLLLQWLKVYLHVTSR